MEGSLTLITFENPEGIKNELEQGGPAYSIRVSTELGKYEVGKHFRTAWNKTVVVTRVQKFNNIADWEYAYKLPPDVIKKLSNHNQIEVIELTYTSGDNSPVVDRSLARNQRYDALIV